MILKYVRLIQKFVQGDTIEVVIEVYGDIKVYRGLYLTFIRADVFIP